MTDLPPVLSSTPKEYDETPSKSGVMSIFGNAIAEFFVKDEKSTISERRNLLPRDAGSDDKFNSCVNDLEFDQPSSKPNPWTMTPISRKHTFADWIAGEHAKKKQMNK